MAGTGGLAVAEEVTVRDGPGREMRGGLLPLALALAVLAGARGAAGQGGGGAPPPPAQGRRVVAEAAPGARAVQPLLARLWASGFFKRCEAVERELGNNDYSFFGEDSPKPPAGNKGLGCFSRGPAGNDVIYLKKELFASFEVGLEGVVIHPGWSRQATPVLVHELCHDLWANVLDEAERASFCREGAEFMDAYRMAQTPEDRRLFLARAGDDAADPRTLRSYAGIDEILGLRPVRLIRGHELFAWLAERLFTTKARIPRPLRKYYAGILE